MRLLTISYILLSLLMACSDGELEQGEEAMTEERGVENGERTENEEAALPSGIQKLLSAYPDFWDRADQEALWTQDQTKFVYDDGIPHKSYDSLLNYPDLEDQMSMPYPKGRTYLPLEPNEDPGRVRYEPLFTKMYGATKEAVRKNLVEIRWLPSTLNQSLLISKVNGVAEKLQAISDTLDKLPHLHKYLQKPGGTFNWRKIAGTDRLSMHSFGVTIDINVKYSHYWRWATQKNPLLYQNEIPLEIVEIFEHYGFIWGGKWYHYDTMHFEYRPELL